MTTEAAIGDWWFLIHRIQRSSLKGQNPIIDSIPTKPMSVKNAKKKKNVSLQPLAAVALWPPLWDSLLFFLPRWGQLTSHRNVPWMSQRVGSSSSPTCHGPRARQMNIWMRWKFRDGKAKWWIPHWCVFYMCWPSSLTSHRLVKMLTSSEMCICYTKKRDEEWNFDIQRMLNPGWELPTFDRRKKNAIDDSCRPGPGHVKHDKQHNNTCNSRNVSGSW